MKKIISHFWYSRTQRNGILALIGLISVIQIIYQVFDFPKEENVNAHRIEKIRMKLDSLSAIAMKKSKPKIFPFNPNFITDYKGYQLGMSVEEIDRLHLYREEGKFVNSAKEFQKITKVPDSLLNKISIYFKFPDWVNKRNQNQKKKKYYNPVKEGRSKLSTRDLNKALVSDFESLESVNYSLANRIVNYRRKLQGFYFQDQIYEVWNIDSDQVKEILNVFTIETKPVIEKININTASFKKILSIPYIDYDLCKKLFEYRDEVAELQSISEIKNVEGFPMNKYHRIVLYLHAE